MMLEASVIQGFVNDWKLPQTFEELHYTYLENVYFIDRHHLCLHLYEGSLVAVAHNLVNIAPCLALCWVVGVKLILKYIVL